LDFGFKSVTHRTIRVQLWKAVARESFYPQVRYGVTTGKREKSGPLVVKNPEQAAQEKMLLALP
jgi:hypothetical protein